MQDGRGTFTWANGAVYEVSGKIINVKVKEPINGVTETYMRATGKTTVPMDKVL